mmetsp:Transcript_6262/g.9210  ORF Transcript_6262/g.9210 Transcript_6262/m.9210 type:complete len:118 (-) Transcript_6262:326-679(-)
MKLLFQPTMTVRDYIYWVKEHINDCHPNQTTSNCLTPSKCSSIAKELESLLNLDEFGYLMEYINCMAIPEPQPLIKDHKKKKNGQCPTHLVIPSTKFASTLSKISYLGIKKSLMMMA